ncbi:beta-1,3-galactosyltransferase 5-like [Mercenaria mercenaria]|uniref:beta-1,3-galactosyltransferase 5-like n=1 Tax=Mercenaria mercenaria TaxID=6596 RepID=UPI00234FA417|nr:beta-1,3-galactosyltransferase 5-like [Mercenaria mercenaria]XP_045170412.2 beta-1,3-galactosyltransferase 5-like [Mercenaria mercenaria]
MNKKALLYRSCFVLFISTFLWILMASVVDIQSPLRYEPSPFQRDGSDVIETEYFDDNKTDARPQEDNYVITGEYICDNINKQFIVILIPSLPKEIGVRNILRKTWINALKTNSWPNEKLVFEFRVAFIFGNGYSGEENALLKAEKEVYGDIIQGDFIDNFKNITRKILFGLKWVTEYCPTARYIMKTNVDTFAHIPKLFNKIQAYNDSFGGKIFCRLHENTVPSKEGELQFVKTTNRLQYYPPYCDGAVYVISGDAVQRLVRASGRMPYIPLEDIYTTGILARMAKVNRINILPKLNLKNIPEWECIFQSSEENDLVYIADSGYRPSQVAKIWKCLKYGPDLNDYIRSIDIELVLSRLVYFFVVLLILLKCYFYSVRTEPK